MGEENGDPEIKVTDRRRFSAEGEPLEETEDDQEPERAAASETLRQSPPLPPASFELLVLSLRWQAEMQLGLYGSDSESGRTADLEGARHTVDMLGILQEKTKGNLSLEEQRLLENTLTELRFRYVSAAEKAVKKS